jgi:hypothetical protein
MKNIVYMAFALMLCTVVNVVKAEEQYWETIKTLIINYDKAKGIQADEEAGKKLTDFIGSLTTEQLMEAFRQCSEEGNESFHKKGFAEGTGFVISFFIYHYPKIAGLDDLRPIFKDIEDENQTDMWRSALIHSFKTSLWQKQLSDSQLREVANNIDKILITKNVYYRLISESLYTTKAMLQEIENRNAKNISSVNDVNVNIQGEKAEEITEYYTRFSRRLMDISSEPNLNPELQMVSFALLRDILDKPIGNKAEVKTTLADAVRNYERYDVKTWRLLSQIGIEKLELPDGNEIAKAMMAKLEIRIKNEPNNVTKRPFQSELESIKRCTKKTD